MATTKGTSCNSHLPSTPVPRWLLQGLAVESTVPHSGKVYGNLPSSSGNRRDVRSGSLIVRMMTGERSKGDVRKHSPLRGPSIRVLEDGTLAVSSRHKRILESCVERRLLNTSGATEASSQQRTNTGLARRMRRETGSKGLNLHKELHSELCRNFLERKKKKVKDKTVRELLPSIRGALHLNGSGELDNATQMKSIQQQEARANLAASANNIGVQNSRGHMEEDLIHHLIEELIMRGGLTASDANDIEADDGFEESFKFPGARLSPTNQTRFTFANEERRMEVLESAIARSMHEKEYVKGVLERYREFKRRSTASGKGRNTFESKQNSITIHNWNPQRLKDFKQDGLNNSKGSIMQDHANDLPLVDRTSGLIMAYASDFLHDEEQALTNSYYNNSRLMNCSSNHFGWDFYDNDFLSLYSSSPIIANTTMFRDLYNNFYNDESKNVNTNMELETRLVEAPLGSWRHSRSELGSRTLDGCVLKPKLIKLNKADAVMEKSNIVLDKSKYVTVPKNIKYWGSGYRVQNKTLV